MMNILNTLKKIVKFVKKYNNTEMIIGTLETLRRDQEDD